MVSTTKERGSNTWYIAIRDGIFIIHIEISFVIIKKGEIVESSLDFDDNKTVY